MLYNSIFLTAVLIHGSPNMPFGNLNLPREEPERTKVSASTSAAQSRRAKNAAHVLMISVSSSS